MLLLGEELSLESPAGLNAVCDGVVKRIDSSAKTKYMTIRLINAVYLDGMESLKSDTEKSIGDNENSIRGSWTSKSGIRNSKFRIEKG